MTTSAKIVADSINSMNVRLTTFEVIMPRVVLAELNTHRVFSNSAQSSRAVPIGKLIRSILKTPYVPRTFRRNVGGMSGGKPMRWQFLAKAIYFAVMYVCIAGAWLLDKLGCSKEIANRLLEPFAYICVVITATEYENFFNLRISEHADEAIRDLAVAMKAAMVESDPRLLIEGEWHSPYDDDPNVSAAHCARRSYQTRHDQTHGKTENRALAIRLQRDAHWSPFEHQAAVGDGDGRNFGPGWVQNRALLEGFYP